MIFELYYNHLTGISSPHQWEICWHWHRMELLRLSYRPGHNPTAPRLPPASTITVATPLFLSLSFPSCINLTSQLFYHWQGLAGLPPRVKLCPFEAQTDNHTTIPGPLLNQNRRKKRLITCWGTIVLFLPSLSLSFWHVDHGKPAVVIRVFRFGWLSKLAKMGVTGWGWWNWLGTAMGLGLARAAWIWELRIGPLWHKRGASERGWEFGSNNLSGVLKQDL